MSYGTLSLVLALAGIASGACGGDFEPPSRVKGLRLLAVRADHPYAAPGSTVGLDALAIDTRGRSISWGWGLCPDPAATTAVACIDELDWSTFVVGEGEAGARHELAIPIDALGGRAPEARAQASLGVVVVACPGALSASSLQGNIRATGALPFTCRDRESGEPLPLGEFAVGLKRVFVRDVDRNANPTIARIEWDGSEWPVTEVKSVTGCAHAGHDYEACSGASHAVVPILASDAREAGLSGSGDAFTEQVVVAYYTVGGVFEHDLRVGDTPGTRWAPQPLEAAPSKVWIVVRDDRGGVSWAERSVLVD